MDPRRHEPAQGHLGATYYPTTDEDHYGVPLISPLPQRARQEVPQHLQQNLANLELNSARDSYAASPASSVQHGRSASSNSLPLAPSAQRRPSNYQNTQGTAVPIQAQNSNALQPPVQPSSSIGSSAPSPFPPLKQRPHDVPPADDEREAQLAGAQDAVLNSSDPEMQVAWAQDVLQWVDVASEDASRNADSQGLSRPSSPRVAHSLRVEAINILSFLADQHHPKAEFSRGLWLEFGKYGFPMDLREAFRCYSRSSQQGYARSEYRMGMQFENSTEVEKALLHYDTGVQRHDAAAHYRMGMMYLLGQHGRRADIRRGLDLIRFAADNADENAPQGSYVYGMLLAQELPQIVVPHQFLTPDPRAAFYYLKKAAFLGFGKAQSRVGAAYELAQLECPFDPVLSLHYNRLAARQGEVEAELAISKWFLSGHEGIFPKNEAVAFQYARRAAHAGLPTAEFAMGYYYEVGIFVSVDIAEARKWYQRAAQHGNQDASGRIDGISRSKTLSRKDHEKVAMARLASTRASRPNQRPTRFQQAPSQINSDASIPLVMPDGPSIDSPNGSMPPPGTPFTSNAQRYGAAMPSPSSTSITNSPYQSSFAPSTRPAGLSSRTDSLQHMSAPPVANFNQPDPYGRPSSINAAGAGGSGTSTPAGSRPLPAPNRILSGPSPASTPPVQADRRTTSAAYPAPGPGTPSQGWQARPSPVPGGPPDIGFIAPGTIKVNDRRNASPRRDPGRPRPSQMPDGRGRGDAAPVAKPGPPKVGASQAAVATGSSRPSTVPAEPGLGRPRLPAAAAPVAATPPPAIGAAGKPPAAAAGRVPGKGPSTFDEMGVPPTKREDDCIVM